MKLVEADNTLATVKETEKHTAANSIVIERNKMTETAAQEVASKLQDCKAYRIL